MTYTLIRSKTRRRSLSLRLDASGELIVRAPLYTPKFFIDHFVSSKQAWIEKQRLNLTNITKKHQYFTQPELEEFVQSQVTRYEQILDLHPTSIKFKSIKSYWGNCHSSGRLTFNYALQYAPAPAVEYVVVHELAHLRYKGHGKRFWALVTKTYPRTREMKKILRKLPHITM